MFGSRLGARILAAMALVLVVASIASLALFLPLYRHELTIERQAVSTKLGAFLQITLENAMLKRDIDGLREIVDRLGQVPSVVAIAILNPALETRFSSDPARLGAQHPSLAALCPDCALSGERGGVGAAFVSGKDGAEVLRSVNAVANREPCTQCHGPVAEHPVNGFLIVDYDAGSLKERAWRTAAFMSLAGFLVVFLALAAAWWTLQRFVLRPVAALTRASSAIAAGDFSARAALTGSDKSDEISALGHTFDGMASRLAEMVADLNERDQFLQGVIDAIPDGIRVIDEDHSVIAANAEFCRQSGLSLDEVLSRPCHASSHGRAEPCVATLVVCPLVALDKDTPSIKCMHSHCRAGVESELAVEVVAARLATEMAGRPRRLIVEAIRDLSQNLEVSQEQRLSEIGQLATGIAHEIHNPLASVRFGLSALEQSLQGGSDPEKAKRYINLVANEIERCIEVTGRLMRLSQTPSERGTLVDLGKIAEDVSSLLSYEALVRQLEVVVDVSADARIIASESEIGMVLVNLIQNAFHATSAQGRVTVTGRALDSGEVEIAVADTGIGIPAEDIAKIFQPFWTRRADQSTGSGLGLSICKALVAKWRGAISVTSTPGAGASFRLVFPHADSLMDAS